MPLKKAPRGASVEQKRKVASENIAKMRREGYPPKQAVAAGLRAAGLGRSKRKAR